MKIPQEVLDDFRNHLYFCFKHLGLGEPTKIQYEIAREIQEGANDCILTAGRGLRIQTSPSWFFLILKAKL